MTLEVKIFSQSIEVTDHIRDQVMKKVSNLDRFLGDINTARVDLKSTNARNAEEREVAQITVRGKGIILRAEERAGDILGALNLAVDTIQRRIKRYKGKRNQRWKQAQNKVDFDSVPYEDENEERIVRRKEFTIRPMDEWEAVEQMELLGHDQFFVFYNAKTDSINVLYRRKDDTYGLLQPEVTF